jgi:MscS family membrane protein
MSSFRTRLGLLFSVLALALPLVAQSLPSQVQKAIGPEPAPPVAPSDALGRETPSGTVYGFLQAAQSGNYTLAGRYLQFRSSVHESDREQLASELKIVVDRAFIGTLKNISAVPDGTLQPGMPSDRQRIGLLEAGDAQAELDLVRINDPASGKIWLFSSETLAAIPDVYGQLQARQIEKKLPASLVKHEIAGAPLWQWLAMMLALPLAALGGWVLMRLLWGPLQLWRRYRNKPQLTRRNGLSGPIWLISAVVLEGIAVRYLGLPLLQRHYYYLVSSVVFIIAFTWLILKIVDQGMRQLRDRAVAYGRTGTGSLVLLGQRILKAALLIVSGLTILAAVGFNLTTVLAGLGIGGIAIAFAAQKTLENLFGGVSLLGDEVIRVGDVCKIGDRVGTVEDISLRSTRIRTTERSELSIPNGSLATMNLENLSRRDKLLWAPVFGLRYETSPDQLRYVLAEVRRMLYEHPKVDVSSARVRFAELANSSLNVEIFSYLLTTDQAEFTAIREDLLLRIVDIVNNAGTGFAFPSRTMYVTRDHGLDQEKSEVAIEQVKQWRDEKQLPFPDHSPADVSAFRGTIPYPPAESTISNNKRK